MGTFSTDCTVTNILDRSRSVEVPKLLVHTGAEYTWIPHRILESIGIIREKKDLVFVMANGTQITRSVGLAILRILICFTVDEVVFAEDGDPLLLGARTLEGLSLTVDSSLKKLLASGPLPAA